jgi:EmrB/QacA subfamily drug resistance transporter
MGTNRVRGEGQPRSYFAGIKDSEKTENSDKAGLGEERHSMAENRGESQFEESCFPIESHDNSERGKQGCGIEKPAKNNCEESGLSTESPDEKELSSPKQPAGPRPSAQHLHGVPLMTCCISLLICLFLTALDQTVIVTMLSKVGQQFGDFGEVSWLSTGFLLPPAVLSLSWGKLAVIFGRKYSMLIGIAVFEVGSLICALSNSMDMLIAGRVIAGVGGGAIQNAVYMILAEIVPLSQRGTVSGFVGLAYVVASSTGPLIGGAFTDSVSWRWNFYINLPLGGVAFACMFYFFNPPKTPGTMKEKICQIDYPGNFAIATGLTLLLVAITFGSIGTPWSSAEVISLLVISGVLLVVFCIYNFRFSKKPLVSPKLCSIPTVVFPCLSFFGMFGAYTGSLLYLGTYFQIVRHHSALQSGIDLFPVVIPDVLSYLLVGYIISKIRWTKPFALLGPTLFSIGMGLCCTMDENTSTARSIGYLIVLGSGVGTSFQSIGLNLQVATPKENEGVLHTAAMLGFTRNFGGVVGSTIGQMVESVIFVSQLRARGFESGSDYDLLGSPDRIYELPQEQRDVAIASFVKAFQSVMYFSLALSLTSFACSLFLTNKRIEKDE